MERSFKTEGSILYSDNDVLTWGPFYFHSINKAKAKMDKIMNWIVEWCNSKDPSLNIEPQDIHKTIDGSMIAFDIKAWKDENTLEDCGVIINVEEIFFED